MDEKLNIEFTGTDGERAQFEAQVQGIRDAIDGVRKSKRVLYEAVFALDVSPLRLKVKGAFADFKLLLRDLGLSSGFYTTYLHYKVVRVNLDEPATLTLTIEGALRLGSLTKDPRLVHLIGTAVHAKITQHGARSPSAIRKLVTVEARAAGVAPAPREQRASGETRITVEACLAALRAVHQAPTLSAAQQVVKLRFTDWGVPLVEVAQKAAA